MLTDDGLYAAAMLMFAALPLVSMCLRSKPESSSNNLEPAKLIALAAFTLLLWLQLRNMNGLGVAMVTLNWLLRLLELLIYDGAVALFWAWTTQPRLPWRQSRKEAVILFLVFGACGSSSMKLARRIVAASVFEQSAAMVFIVRMLVATLIYPWVLLTIGTLCGRHEFAARLLCHHCRRHHVRKGGGQHTRDVEV